MWCWRKGPLLLLLLLLLLQVLFCVLVVTS
jgi:hypothetical protein